MGKRNGRKYTVEEGKKIIEYIIDNYGLFRLRGNALWKQMEKGKVLNRTWQSMKEHFRMKIVQNLNLYGISKEHQKHIITGYNCTSTVDKNVKHINFDLSSEEIQTSSDDSSNLAIGIEEYSPTPKKEIKKETNKSKPKTRILNSAETASSFLAKSKNETQEETDVTSLSDSVLSLNVSSTNIDSGYIEISMEEKEKFLRAITKDESNFSNWSCVVKFIKQYTDNHAVCQYWTDLYDVFVEIIELYLHFYDFLTPDIIKKLQNLKEPLQVNRSNCFQEPKNEISINLPSGDFRFAVGPDPEVVYVKEEEINLLSCLDKIRTGILEVFEIATRGEPDETASSCILNLVKEFSQKHGLETPVDSNHNCGTELSQTPTQKTLESERENPEVDELSDTIPIQPDITFNILEKEK